MKSQLEEQHKIEEGIRRQLLNKEKDHERLEDENATLKREIDRITSQRNKILKFERSSLMLDNIVNYKKG